MVWEGPDDGVPVLVWAPALHGLSHSHKQGEGALTRLLVHSLTRRGKRNMRRSSAHARFGILFSMDSLYVGAKILKLRRFIFCSYSRGILNFSINPRCNTAEIFKIYLKISKKCSDPISVSDPHPFFADPDPDPT
jgi:hypothetical protein